MGEGKIEGLRCFSALFKLKWGWGGRDPGSLEPLDPSFRPFGGFYSSGMTAGGKYAILELLLAVLSTSIFGLMLIGVFVYAKVLWSGSLPSSRAPPLDESRLVSLLPNMTKSVAIFGLWGSRLELMSPNRSCGSCDVVGFDRFLYISRPLFYVAAARGRLPYKTYIN